MTLGAWVLCCVAGWLVAEAWILIVEAAGQDG